MFGFYVYFVFYLIFLLFYLMLFLMVLVVWQMVVYCGLLWVVCFFVVRWSGSFVFVLMFGMIVVVNLNWFLGIQGQFYLDCLFVCVGFVLMWVFYICVCFWFFLLILLFLVVFNECVVLIGGLLIGMYVVLFGIGQGVLVCSWVVILIGIVGLLLVYVFLVKKYIFINVYYFSYMFVSFLYLMDCLVDGVFFWGIVCNLLNNVFLLILVFFVL